MSERRAHSMKGPELLEVFLPGLKNNDFFVCQVQGINTPGLPLFCRSPLIYKQDTKVSLFLPSMAFLIQTSFLFGVLFLTSIRFFPFLYGPLSLFVFRFLTFFYFWIVSLYRKQSPGLTPFPFCSLSVCTSYYSSSLFLFISLLPALISLSLAPISSPWFSSFHRDALWPDILSLLPTQSNCSVFRTRMEQKGQDRENRKVAGWTCAGRGQSC